MSRLKKMIPSKENENKKVNHMGGVSYTLNPLDTMRMITSSSMFMEPKYYHKDEEYPALKIDRLANAYMIIKPAAGENAGDMMVKSINKALDYDFAKTLDLAVELRTAYNVRVAPQLVMVLAAMHSGRKSFDEQNPGKFRETNLKVMQRADEPACQLACWLWLNDWKKNGIPSILKRSWKDRVEKMTAYEMNKYKNAEAGLINLIRVCHAKGEQVADLMKDGKLDIKEDEQTWENLHSAGKTFTEILNAINMPHMALLRNLRNILAEANDFQSPLIAETINLLKRGVKNGKQFPFRYYAAYKAIEHEPNSAAFRDALEECIDESAQNLPKLKGKTVCLSDNSGSAWGAFTSEYGSNTIALIDNLNSVIAASRSDSGSVIKFGDEMIEFPVSKRDGLLGQANRISNEECEDVGGSTENGIWLFFEKAIKNNEWYDNIFIFSDQQAGHGGLYGKGADYLIDGESFKSNARSSNYVDVLKLLNKYRSKVNPKVNFFSVQTAGYDDALIPEFIYRGAVLTGWTGKEVNFAAKLIEQWDDIEKSSENNK